MGTILVLPKEGAVDLVLELESQAAAPEQRTPGGQLHAWLWLFRVHLFGMVTAAMAVVTLAALLADRPARLLVWPGAAVTVAWFIVGAAGSAFYYHFGVWRALDTQGQPPEASRSLVEALKLIKTMSRAWCASGGSSRAWAKCSGQYCPCGSAGRRPCSAWRPWLSRCFFADSWPLYTPIFHLQALWLAATGFALLAAAPGT
jgi:hypothetical protein